MPIDTPRVRRLWRLRKLHQTVDVTLCELSDDAGAELTFFYNGGRTYVRTWPTVASALQEAADRRAELERDGWSFHW